MHETPPRCIGLAGVWTEAKITFLAFNLRIRYPDAELTDWMPTVEDLGRELPLPAQPFRSPAIQRAAQTVQQLRSYYPSPVKADRDPVQLLIGQVRYAVHNRIGNCQDLAAT